MKISLFLLVQHGDQLLLLSLGATQINLIILDSANLSVLQVHVLCFFLPRHLDGVHINGQEHFVIFDGYKDNSKWYLLPDLFKKFFFESSVLSSANPANG